MSASIERVYLAVPYAEREQAKALGARWDREAKSWFIASDRDAAALARWHKTAEQAADPRQQFANEMRRAGFRLDGPPQMDGQIHRVPVEGDKGPEKNGSYRGFLDGKPNGWFQNFKTTDKPVQWKSETPLNLTPKERAELAATGVDNRRDAEQKRQQEAALASQKAIEILANAAPVTTGHAYLTSKQVQSHGLFIAAPGTSIEAASGREIDITGRLLVPIRSPAGNVVSLQIIDDQGAKMFLRGGKVAGAQHVIGDASSPWPLHVAEGYATAAAVHEATGHSVVVAFNAHNLGLVAAQQRAARPDRSIFIAGDNDHHLPAQKDDQGRPKRNVGRDATIAAANAIGGYALIPDFKPGDRGTDWNDAVRDRGIDAVRAELAAGLAKGAREKIARDLAQQRGYGVTAERERSREACCR